MIAVILFIAFIIAQVGNTGLSNGIELYADTSVQRARDLTNDIDVAVTKVDALRRQGHVDSGPQFQRLCARRAAQGRRTGHQAHCRRV
jgi:hypothetical protein